MHLKNKTLENLNPKYIQFIKDTYNEVENMIDAHGISFDCPICLNGNSHRIPYQFISGIEKKQSFRNFTSYHDINGINNCRFIGSINEGIVIFNYGQQRLQ